MKSKTTPLPANLMTPKEVAELLNVKVERLAICITGEPTIPFIKLGRCIRYDPRAVQAFIDGNVANTTGELVER